LKLRRLNQKLGLRQKEGKIAMSKTSDKSHLRMFDGLFPVAKDLEKECKAKIWSLQ